MKRSHLRILLIGALLMEQLQASVNTQKPDKESSYSINVFVNTANQATLDQKNNASQTSQNASQQNNTNNQAQIQDSSNWDKKFQDFYEEQSKLCKSYGEKILEWINTHKMKTFYSCLSIAYTYIAYQIYQANQVINNPQSWSNWRHAKSFEELLSMPHHQLEADLLFEIQSRYVNPTDLTDFMYSLTQARASLDKEIDIMESQLNRYKLLHKAYCINLFFLNAQDLSNLEEKYKKLIFMKHLFSSWCAQYKIDKLNKKQ